MQSTKFNGTLHVAARSCLDVAVDGSSVGRPCNDLALVDSSPEELQSMLDIVAKINNIMPVVGNTVLLQSQ